jgi:hypothetical protein
MMGRQPKVQKKLFYSKFNLDGRVRKNLNLGSDQGKYLTINNIC